MLIVLNSTFFHSSLQWPADQQDHFSNPVLWLKGPWSQHKIPQGQVPGAYKNPSVTKAFRAADAHHMTKAYTAVFDLQLRKK